MARAKQRADWDRTASIWALLVNAHSDPKKQGKPAHPADVHPFRDRQDYVDEVDHDAAYHQHRRLAMLPPQQRARVARKVLGGDNGRGS